MKKIKNFVLGGIENKLFNLILVSILLVAGAFIASISYQNSVLVKISSASSQEQKESISQITSGVMDDVVDSSMDQITRLEAMLADTLFDGLRNRVEMLGDYATKLLIDPDQTPKQPFSSPDPNDNGKVLAQLILADDTQLTTQLRSRIGTIANMSDMMISLFGASEVTNSCFVALPEGAFLVVDDRSSSKFDENGNAISYDCRTRPWYKEAVEKEDLIFTDVEIDAFTGDIGIVCAMPVYVDGKLEAVVGSDLFLTSMNEQIQSSDENGGFLFVVNQNGHVVFSPKSEGLFAVRNSSDSLDLRESGNDDLSSLISDGLKEATGVRKVELDGKEYFMTGVPLNTVGWTLVSAFDQQILYQPVELLEGSYDAIQEQASSLYRSQSGKVQRNTSIVLILLMIAILGGAIVFGKKIVSPLNRIVARISNLSEKDLEFKMEDTYKTGDEIQVLAESFAAISHRTVTYLDEVKRITSEKQRIQSELDMARRIQSSMMPNIFPAFPGRSQFDVYASVEPAKGVGGDFYDFFLIDEDHLALVMADVSGKGIPAASFMMACKIILQSCAMLGKSAAEILEKTNQAICSNNSQEMFVTVWLGILEVSTGKMTAANAGHEYPAIKAPDGDFELFKDPHGFVIGGMDGVKYKEYQLQLKPGSKIFLYTDGVPEATDNRKKMFTLDRMIQALNKNKDANPQMILKNVRDAVNDFVKDAEQFDDLTMMCLEYKGDGSEKPLLLP